MSPARPGSVPLQWQPLAAAALESAGDAVILCDSPPGDFAPGDRTFLIRYVNAAFERQTGYTRDEAVGKPVDLLYGPGTDLAAMAALRQAIIEMRPVSGSLRKYRKDGTPFWADVNVRPIAAADGGLAGIVMIQRDATEDVETKEELELLSRAIDYANDGIAIFKWDDARRTWCIRHVNESFLKMTGYELGEVIGRSSDFLAGELTDRRRLEQFRALLYAGEPVRGEIAFYRKDGSHVWTDLNGKGLRDPDGTIAHTIVVYRDITEKHRYEERLTFEAAHDSLTGIFNRRYILHAVEDAVADAKTRDVTHGLIFFDLDGFKPINDEFGHEAGDQLLVEFAKTINGHMRSGDVFGRMGGDEFAILLFGCPSAITERIANQLLDVVRSFALLWRGHTLRVGASLGAVTIDRTTTDAQAALRAADAACYAAKSGGRNRVVLLS